MKLIFKGPPLNYLQLIEKQLKVKIYINFEVAILEALDLALRGIFLNVVQILPTVYEPFHRLQENKVVNVVSGLNAEFLHTYILNKALLQLIAKIKNLLK